MSEIINKIVDDWKHITVLGKLLLVSGAVFLLETLYGIKFAPNTEYALLGAIIMWIGQTYRNDETS